jgi:hypothetical protein
LLLKRHIAKTTARAPTVAWVEGQQVELEQFTVITD